MSRRHALIASCALTAVTLTLAAVPAGAERRVADAPVAHAVPSADAAVPVASATLKPPPGMVRALARDLRLTLAEASERLANEARFAPIAEQLVRRLGPRLGGVWLRGATANNLVTATTSATDIPSILAAGSEAEVVSRPLAELAAIQTRLDAANTSALVSSTRFIDVKRNKVIVLSPKPDAAESFVESTDVDRDAVIVLTSSETPLPLYDLVGGNAYYIGTSERCSIGFPVFKGTQPGFVSAGHCGKPGDTTTGFNRAPQGVFQGSTFPGNDYSWVAVNADWTPTPAVDNGEGGTVPVAGARVAIEGASVCRSGSTTEWHCGLIQQRGASVTYPQGTVSGVTRTSVCAEPGDSGGSFISVDQAQGVTSGGSGNCDEGGTTYFQPIGPILSTYGLTLKTTTGGGSTPPPVAGGCTGFPNIYTGTLADGASAYQPKGRYYRSTAGGVHAGCLAGADGVDFDLYLQKWNGRSWAVVATSDGPGPDESISYTGTPGYYRYRVVSSSGAGAYTLRFKVP
ncbi:S1 family peptidase [Streptosporangium sp. NPDC049046]|uniref:S1 family peptidase n=1 Tax=Streptosporangium sp. NPDC049046 TaxID=3155031 RepID=UPI003449132B